jgi:hypothetical protein
LIRLGTHPISSTTSHNTLTMPPRVGARAGNIAASQQCLRTTGNARQSVASQRDFSQSSDQQFHATCKNDTRLRRNMFSWINGPGRVFREPLPGSTNYLGAYDRSGNLMRLRAGADQDNEQEDKVDTSKLNEEEKAKYEKEKEAKAAEDRDNLPRERASDLRPYPLNNDFRSQSILSEELRLEIYKKIVDEKVDLSTVSALYGVDMRRVAAVVRLKTIENNWVSEVCRALSYPTSASCPPSMMRHTKIRLVFMTPTWIQRLFTLIFQNTIKAFTKAWLGISANKPNRARSWLNHTTTQSYRWCRKHTSTASFSKTRRRASRTSRSTIFLCTLTHEPKSSTRHPSLASSHVPTQQRSFHPLFCLPMSGYLCPS